MIPSGRLSAAISVASASEMNVNGLGARITLITSATVAAMQSAVRALLAEFDPVKLRLSAARGGLDFVPLQRKAHAWDAFEALYSRITQALADNFDSAFGKAFARAYEQALAEASAKEAGS